ncbi:MAG: chemotaxis protein CheC [ANME-2 cluster archaeon]|nr:chemotaxis protein CheC [ANME-2 cluster archaeon]
MDRMGRLSSRNAATSLSRLLDRKVNVRFSDIFFLPLDDIQYLLGDPGTLVVGIHHELQVDLDGSLLTLIPLELAREHLCSMLKKDINDEFVASPTGYSCLGELSNILCGSYISIISNLLNITIIPSVPQVTIDMMGAITQDSILKLNQETFYALTVKSELLIAGNVISINILLLLEQESINKIIDKIDLKVGID